MSMCGVQHPNILRLYGFLRNGDQSFLVTQYTEAGNLEKLINDHSITWTWELFVKIAEQIIDAFRCMHAHGITHLDLNPRDVLISFSDEFSQLDGEGSLNFFSFCIF